MRSDRQPLFAHLLLLAVAFVGAFAPSASAKGNGSPTNVHGDYNANGIVDAADYTVWRDTLGHTGANLAADGNTDMMVNSADYDDWKARFGQESNSRSDSETDDGANRAIPEPASLLLFAMLLLVAAMWRWFDLRVAANRS